MKPIAVLLVAILVVAAFLAIYSIARGFHLQPAPQPEVIHSNVRLGLELTVTFSSEVAVGHNLTIVAEVNNTLPRMVNLNTTSLTNPAHGPCQQDFATSIEIYSGNYSYVQLFNNRSQPTPLLLYNPSLIYTCPALFAFAYAFHPNSSFATIEEYPGGFQAGKNETRTVEETSVVTGYWTGSDQNYSFHALQPGRYTVVVYDAWGHQLVGYFQVE